MRSSVTALYSFDYDHDAIGRITRKTGTIAGTTTVYEYGYDAVGQLDQVTTDAQVTHTWTYDANGNRLTAIENGLPQVTRLRFCVRSDGRWQQPEVFTVVDEFTRQGIAFRPARSIRPAM